MAVRRVVDFSNTEVEGALLFGGVYFLVEVQHQGMVLEVNPRSYPIKAAVWTGEAVAEVVVAEDYEESLVNTAEVDSSQPVVESATGWALNVLRKRYTERVEVKRAAVEVGRRVRITRGKGAGTEGTVFYKAEKASQFGPGTYWCIGIATSDRKVGGRLADVAWSTLEKVECLDKEEATFDEDAFVSWARPHLGKWLDLVNSKTRW